MSGFVLVVSGPSGAGKSTLLGHLLSEFKDEVYFSVSCTTRKPREGEKEGINYHFISENDFKMGIERGEFLEHALVHGNFYGTRLKETLQMLDLGKIIVFDIDVQGFFLVRDKLKDRLCSVFIAPPSLKELENRLLSRQSGDENLAKRLQNAKDEMKALSKYDYFIINEDLEKSYRHLKSIFEAEKLKISRYNVAEILQKY